MNIINDLKKLANGEIVAALQYKIFAESLEGGEDFDYIRDHCLEHYEEEFEHYTLLVNALKEFQYECDLRLKDIFNNTDPKTNEIKDTSTDYTIDFLINAEEDAINSYVKFYDKIKDEYYELSEMILDIIDDEEEHKEDFEKLLID